MSSSCREVFPRYSLFRRIWSWISFFCLFVVVFFGEVECAIPPFFLCLFPSFSFLFPFLMFTLPLDVVWDSDRQRYYGRVKRSEACIQRLHRVEHQSELPKVRQIEEVTGYFCTPETLKSKSYSRFVRTDTSSTKEEYSTSASQLFSHCKSGKLSSKK